MLSNYISMRTLQPKIKEFKLSFYLLNQNVLTRGALILLLILVFIAIFPW